jgi:hypothetical protein
MTEWLAVAVAAVSAACAVLSYRLERHAAFPERNRATRILGAFLRARSTATVAVSVAAAIFILAISGALRGSSEWEFLTFAAVSLFASVGCLVASRRGARPELAPAATFLAVATLAATAPAVVPEDRGAFAAGKVILVSGSSVERDASYMQAGFVQAAPGDDLLVRIRIAPRDQVTLKDVRVRVRLDGETVRVTATARNAAPLRRVVRLHSIAGPDPVFVPDSAEVVAGRRRDRPAGRTLLVSSQLFSKVGAATDVPAVEVRFGMKTPQPDPRATGSFSCCNLFRVRNENERFGFDETAVASRGDRIRFRLLVDNTSAGRLANVRVRVRQRGSVEPVGVLVAELTADNADQAAPARMRASVSFTPPVRHRLIYVPGSARLLRGDRRVFVRRLSDRLFASGVQLGGLSADIRNNLWVDFVMRVGGRTRAWSSRRLARYRDAKIIDVSAVQAGNAAYAAWSVDTGGSAVVQTAVRRGSRWTRVEALRGPVSTDAPRVRLVADERGDVHLIASTNQHLTLWSRRRGRWDGRQTVRLEFAGGKAYSYAGARRGVVVAWGSRAGVFAAYGGRHGWRLHLVSHSAVNPVGGKVALAIDRRGRPVIAWTQRNSSGRQEAYVATATESRRVLSMLVPHSRSSLAVGARLFLVDDPVRREVAAVLTGGTREETRTAVVDPQGTTRRYTVTVIDQPTTYAWNGSTWRPVRPEEAYRYSRCCPGGPDDPAETQATISRHGDSHAVWTTSGAAALSGDRFRLEADYRPRRAAREWGWATETVVLLRSPAPIDYTSVIARDGGALVVAATSRRVIAMYRSRAGNWSNAEPVGDDTEFVLSRYRPGSRFATAHESGVPVIVWAGARGRSAAVFVAGPAPTTAVSTR